MPQEECPFEAWQLIQARKNTTMANRRKSNEFR